ncbi:uncharacterized protein BDV14DRAFT_166947 [Aspergillus stella-maris]|uniref:uncharacterized protein n=1 Tax=Aspergillus stella-maris TaxID=1810926 RepID=UPI003CCCDAD9
MICLRSACRYMISRPYHQHQLPRPWVAITLSNTRRRILPYSDACSPLPVDVSMGQVSVPIGLARSPCLCNLQNGPCCVAVLLVLTIGSERRPRTELV